MAMNEYPRICGGTFFMLLLQARKQRMKARAHRLGERDGLSDTDMLVSLLKVLNPDYIEPTYTMKSTFRTNTSDFKSCRISSGTYLPLGDTIAFDSRVKSQYAISLRTMCDFVDSFIDFGTSTEKDKRLVKALLELIEFDQSIDDEQIFYIREDGSTSTKTSLRGETRICLPAFLLGVWHFVLVNRKDNTIGKATYDRWCPPNGGAERKYIGTIGDGIQRSICVHMTTPYDPAEDAATASSDEPMEKCDDPHVDDKTKDSSSKVTYQVVNHPFVFNQYGNNNIQVGHIDTVTINKGLGDKRNE